MPKSALVLSVLGTLPFVLGALIALFPEVAANLSNSPIFVARLFGGGILNAYGTVILAFMSGVLWGFATKAPEETASRFYLLSVIPAILVFFNATYSFIAPLVGAGQPSLVPLVLGFIALLGLDYHYWASSLAPDWWMKLRSGITVVVVICLSIGVWAG